MSINLCKDSTTPGTTPLLTKFTWGMFTQQVNVVQIRSFTSYIPQMFCLFGNVNGKKHRISVCF